MQFWTVGWDPSKNGFHALSIVDHEKMEHSAFRVKGVEKALAQIRGLNAFLEHLDYEIRIAVENTDSDVLELVHAEYPGLVYALNARKVKGYKTNVLGEDSKTDELDAFACSCFYIDNRTRLKPFVPPTPLEKEARAIVAELDWVRDQKTIAWERFWSIVDRSCPEIKGLLEKKEVPWFLACFSIMIGKMKHTSYAAFVKFCRKHKARSKDNVLQPLHAQLKILENRQDQGIIRSRAKAIEQLLVEQKYWVERAAGVLDRWGDAWILMSIKGLAEATAVRFLAHLGDDWSGLTFKGTCKYSGLAPRLCSSGYPDEATLMKMPTRKRKYIKMKRRHRVMCNKKLKTTLTVFANFSMVHHDWAHDFYTRARGRGQGQYEALRNLGIKWLKIMFAMMRDKSPYESFKHENAIESKADPLARLS